MTIIEAIKVDTRSLDYGSHEYSDTARISRP